MTKPFDHYNLKPETTNTQEAKRAIRGFINRVENNLPIPSELLTFIAHGLKKQYAKGKIGNWTESKSGRSNIPPHDQLNILAWHHFYLNSKFNNQSKTTESGRYFQIAKRFTEATQRNEKDDLLEYRSEYLAEALSNRNNGLNYLNSESSIKRAVSDFQKYGLRDPNSYDATHHNQSIIEPFCLLVLRLPHENANIEYQKIMQIWSRNKVHK